MEEEIIKKEEMKISIIAAIGKNNELGGDNQLLWRLSDDLKLFKKLTMGHCIIMGRKTFESIGKALPGRINIVVTSGYIDAEGVTSAVDLNDAIEIARESGETEAFIIGGGQIYHYAVELADRLYISHVDGDFPEADIFFPEIENSEWVVDSGIQYQKNEKNAYDFLFKTYIRKGF